jgi:hypothetical protein
VASGRALVVVVWVRCGDGGETLLGNGGTTSGGAVRRRRPTTRSGPGRRGTSRSPTVGPASTTSTRQATTPTTGSCCTRRRPTSLGRHPATEHQGRLHDRDHRSRHGLRHTDPGAADLVAPPESAPPARMRAARLSRAVCDHDPYAVGTRACYLARQQQTPSEMAEPGRRAGLGSGARKGVGVRISSSRKHVSAENGIVPP